MAMNESESVPREVGPQPVRLEYAHRPNPAKKWLRRIAKYLFFAVVIYGSWQYGPLVQRQIRMLVRQRECASYQPGPDSVVYEGDPAAAAVLLSGSLQWQWNDSELGTYDGNRRQLMAAARNPPSCWMQSDVPYNAPVLSNYKHRAPAYLLLRDRVSPAGHRRILKVEFWPRSDGMPLFQVHRDLIVSVWKPATLFRSPENLSDGMWDPSGILDIGAPPPNLRIYAGQADPNDSSHFTIRYNMWGQEDVLDGRLNDDDTVTIAPRHPPKRPDNSSLFNLND